MMRDRIDDDGGGGGGGRFALLFVKEKNGRFVRRVNVRAMEEFKH